MGKDKLVGVALDFSKSSKHALQWAIDNLAGEGSSLYIIHVKHKTAAETGSHIWASDGSPIIPLSEFRDPEIMKTYQVEVQMGVIDMLDEAAKANQVEIYAKIYWGDPREKLLAAIDDLKLESLIMGSRGLSGVKRVLVGSVSYYMLSNAPCPVTIVKA